MFLIIFQKCPYQGISGCRCKDCLELCYQGLLLLAPSSIWEKLGQILQQPWNALLIMTEHVITQASIVISKQLWVSCFVPTGQTWLDNRGGLPADSCISPIFFNIFTTLCIFYSLRKSGREKWLLSTLVRNISNTETKAGLNKYGSWVTSWQGRHHNGETNSLCSRHRKSEHIEDGMLRKTVLSK